MGILHILHNHLEKQNSILHKFLTMIKSQISFTVSAVSSSITIISYK